MKKPPESNEADPARREFLANCGRFATLVPPAMTVLLSTTLTSNAVAASGGLGRHHHHHHHDYRSFDPDHDHDHDHSW